jgi:hypothetical protein
MDVWRWFWRISGEVARRPGSRNLLPTPWVGNPNLTQELNRVLRFVPQLFCNLFNPLFDMVFVEISGR